MLRVLFIGCLVLCVHSVFSQNDSFSELKDKYPDEDIVILDKSEEARISIDKSGELKVLIDHYQEIIYLSDRASRYGQERISFDSFKEISDIKALIHIPKSNGKYRTRSVKDFEIEDVHSSDYFHHDQKRYVIDYPGLEAGYKTSISYTEELKDPHFFGRFFFDSYVPVEKGRFKVTVPQDMQLIFKAFGLNSDKLEFTKKSEGDDLVYEWKAKEFAPLNRESESVSYLEIGTHINVRIGSYRVNGDEKYVLRDTDDLYEYYYTFIENVIKEEAEELETITDSITKDIQGIDQKVEAIYYWVQNNIRYIAFEAGLDGFIPRSAKLVCDRKYGDCKDMSMILFQMINHIGGEAYLTWIGTRDIPYSYDAFPSPAIDNHMICTYVSEGDTLFLDATGSNMPFGVPTGFIQGKTALVGKSKSEYHLVEVPVMTKDFSITADTARLTILDDEVVGSGIVEYKGYPAKYLKQQMASFSESELRSYVKREFKKGNNKCESKLDSISDVHNIKESLQVSYSFKIPDYISSYEDEVYLDPFLKKYFSGFNIKLESNEYPKEKHYKEILSTNVVFNIPPGYQVVSIPMEKEYTADAFGFDINLEHDEEESKVFISVIIEIKELRLEPEEFESWNEFIKTLNETYNQVIVLKKTK